MSTPEANELRSGARVRVEGTSLEDRNGTLGVLLDFFMESKRWGVRFDDGKALQIRPECLTVEAEARIENEEEALRPPAEEEARRKADEEATKKAVEDADARRKAEEETARRAAEEEVKRKADEEAAKKAPEEAEVRRKAEEEAARRAAEEEARRKADEEAARKPAEEAEVRREAAEELTTAEEEDKRDGMQVRLTYSREQQGIRLEGKDGLAETLNTLKISHASDPQSIWLFFDWDKTLKLPMPEDKQKTEEDSLRDAPQWKKNLAKELRGGAATMNALEQSPFQKFIVTAKDPNGSPATGLVQEGGHSMVDPIFLRMHKCFSMINYGGGTIKYTIPDGTTFEYTDDETLKAECWDKVPKNELATGNVVINDLDIPCKFAQNFEDEKDGNRWKFHAGIEDIEHMPPPGKEHPVGGGKHYFPSDEDNGGAMLKRVGNVFVSGYDKHIAIAKAVQLAKLKNQSLPSKIYFFDDNVGNAYTVHHMGAKIIKEIDGLADTDITVEGVFWDPFVEEEAGDAEPAKHWGSDFQLCGIIDYPNFREDQFGAVNSLNPEKLKHFAFYGLDVAAMVKRFDTYLSWWDKAGIKLVETEEEKQQREAEQTAKEAELKEQAAETQRDALAALDTGPKKEGIAKLLEHQLPKAKERRLKIKAELEKFVEGSLNYDALSEDVKKEVSQEDGEDGAKAKLEKVNKELDEIDKRLKPKGSKGKGKIKADVIGDGKGDDGSKVDKGKGKGKGMADATGHSKSDDNTEFGKGKGKGKGKRKAEHG